MRSALELWRAMLRDLTPVEMAGDALGWLAMLGLIWAGFVVAGVLS